MFEVAFSRREETQPGSVTVQMIMEGRKVLMIFNKLDMIDVSDAGAVSEQLQIPLAHLPKSSSNFIHPQQRI